jgi:ribosome-binding factor A
MATAMANRDFSRTRRIADQIGREVATLLVEEFEDRRIRAVTVSGVDVSADKRVATVHVSLPVNAPVEDTMKALKHASSLLRRRLAKRLRTRFLPELRFAYDPSLDQVDRIEYLLRGQLPPQEQLGETDKLLDQDNSTVREPSVKVDLS